MAVHHGGKVGKAGKTLASKSSSKAAKSKAGKTLANHKSKIPLMERSLCNCTGSYSHIKEVSLYNLSESLFKKY